jgi:hypothetical protein
MPNVELASWSSPLLAQLLLGWHEVTGEVLHSVRERLGHFETMTWREILVQGKKQNHAVKINRICSEAQGKLSEIVGALDIDQVVSLRVSATERIWGIPDGSTLKILWWDPAHTICPSLLKNT